MLAVTVLAVLCALRSTASVPQDGPKRSYTDPEHGFHRFGSVVGMAGDVDVDGVPDLILGDPGYEPEGVSPRLWILSGSDGRSLQSIEFPLGPDPCSMVVEAGKDLDDDHVPDLLVGINSQIYVLSGKDGTVLHKVHPPNGCAVATDWLHFVRDRDGDGITDFAVLCAARQGGGGALLFYSGRTGTLVTSVPIANEFGAGTGSFLDVGDRDDDGIHDFALLFDPADSDGGSRPVLCKERAPRTRLRIELSSSRSLLWERDLGGAHYWTNAVLARIGDIDRDGVQELAVGFGEEVVVLNGKSGETRLHFGMANKQSESGLGCALAALGDIDDDDVPDFGLSEWDPGFYEGMVAAVSGKDGRTLWKVSGDFREDDVHHLGYRLAAMGDIDGDKVTDLVVGTDEACDWWASGEAEVLSGKTGARLFQFRRKGNELLVTGGRRAPAEHKQ